MPYHKVEGHSDCPGSKPIAVVKDSDGEVVGCHATEAEADDQIAALHAAEEGARTMSDVDRDVEIVDRALTRAVEMFDKTVKAIQRIAGRLVGRAWDGSASRYDSTEAYCAACLIDVNSAAGRDEKSQSHCMLPAKDPGEGGYNFEGIKAAAGGHGIGQVKKPGDVPQDAWDAAVKKAANMIISQYEANDATAPDSVYEAAGKEPPEERAVSVQDVFFGIDEMMWTMEGQPWLHDVYFDDDGSLFAIASSGGKLYRYGVQIDADGDVELGEATEVVHDFKPTGRTQTRVFRQADGRWRWVSISATAVLNRVGEIDSRALFDSFVANAEETGEYPFRTFYHQGEQIKYGQADFLFRDGYCLITSGLYDLDGEFASLAKAEIRALQEEPDEWGESIGYVSTAPPELVEVAEGVKIPVYVAGVLREVSLLPENDAASLFTAPTRTEVTRMARVEEALKKLLKNDPEEAERIGELVDSRNRAVDEEDLVARAKEGDDETEEQPAESAAEAEEADEEAPKDEATEEAEEVEAGAEEEEAGDESAPADEEDEEGRSLVLDEDAIKAIADHLTPVVSAQAEEIDLLREAVEALTTESRAGRDELNGRLEKVEEDDETKHERWVEDLPRKRETVVTYRPRASAARPDEDPPGSLADNASESIESIKSGQ